MDVGNVPGVGAKERGAERGKGDGWIRVTRLRKTERENSWQKTVLRNGQVQDEMMKTARLARLR